MPLRAHKEADGPFVPVGFDAEWVFKSEGRNRILSYQFAVLNAETGKIATLIVYSKNGKRITIANALASALEKARKQRVIDKIPTNFVLCGHFTRADLTTFDNFGRFKRRISAVRKSYATTRKPLKLWLGQVECTAVIVDTMMLSPAGTSLEALGELLGVPKIELPEGYSKDRMDLFLRDHPKLFETYALTDAIIPAMWVARTYGMLRDRLGIVKKVVTLGGAAVELVRQQARQEGIELNDFLGREKKQPLPHLAALMAVSAQAYHGGYNVATALGFSPAGRELSDLDIRSAYTTALAFIGVPDWVGARHCVDLAQLAVIEAAMTVALVEFRFPDGTVFPCLPVRASNGRGLVYPLEGDSWCTGPELVVAIANGAIVQVKDGYRVDWKPGSIRLFEDITRRIGEIRADAKRQEPPDLVVDKLVKEIGNSVYGKLAQAVAGTRIIKDDIERRTVFDTAYEETIPLGPSAITNAMMAAYCTGLVRALLLETLTRLPAGTWVGTATTDGFLSTCELKDLDQNGPLALAFKAVRERITPGDDSIWELKHQVPGVLVTKTRGTYTVAPVGWNGAGVVLAKAGYMTPPEARGLSAIEQCRDWIKRYRARDFETTMRSKSLTPLREQHLLETDIQAVAREVRWNADYDMKRKLIDVRNADGLITADTVPWRSIGEFERARDHLDGWKRSQRRVLKTREDYEDLTEWAEEQASRRRVGVKANNTLPPMAAAVLKWLAHRLEGTTAVFAGQMWRPAERPPINGRVAEFMSAMCGVKITETHVKDAKRRGAGADELAGSLRRLTDDDRRFLMNWLSFYPVMPQTYEIAERLCAPKSPARAEINDLYYDAMHVLWEGSDSEDPQIFVPESDVLAQTPPGNEIKELETAVENAESSGGGCAYMGPT